MSVFSLCLFIISIVVVVKPESSHKCSRVCSSRVCVPSWRARLFMCVYIGITAWQIRQTIEQTRSMFELGKRKPFFVS